MTRSIPLRTSCLYYRAALFVPPPPSSSPPPFIPFDKTACGFQEGYMKLLQVHRQSPASLYLRLNSPSLPPPPLSRRCCTFPPSCLFGRGRGKYFSSFALHGWKRNYRGKKASWRWWNRKGNTRQFAANYSFPLCCANTRCCTIAHRDVTMLYPDVQHDGRFGKGELKLRGLKLLLKERLVEEWIRILLWRYNGQSLLVILQRRRR